MEPLILVSLVTALALGVTWARYSKRRRLLSEIQGHAKELLTTARSAFLVKSCSRCHEFEMRLLSVSPNARSIEYQCMTCNKKMRAAACSTDAQSAKSEEEQLLRKVRGYSLTFRNRKVEPTLIFSVPEDLLPYEYSAREPIPESMRTEIWRRDNGCCVTCGSRVNLEFDHIIPVSKGGATTTRNLQLLCQQCNRSKGARI